MILIERGRWGEGLSEKNNRDELIYLEDKRRRKMLSIKKREPKHSECSNKDCTSRESNAGPIDGNDGFYH
jgi:hypothetical protein